MPGASSPAAGAGRSRPAASAVEASSGADVIVLMIRVGGLAARRDDEDLSRRFGMPGDEGLGPGGAANALRTLPVLAELADRPPAGRPDRQGAEPRLAPRPHHPGPARRRPRRRRRVRAARRSPRRPCGRRSMPPPARSRPSTSPTPGSTTSAGSGLGPAGPSAAADGLASRRRRRAGRPGRCSSHLRGRAAEVLLLAVRPARRRSSRHRSRPRAHRRPDRSAGPDPGRVRRRAGCVVALAGCSADALVRRRPGADAGRHRGLGFAGTASPTSATASSSASSSPTSSSRPERRSTAGPRPARAAPRPDAPSGAARSSKRSPGPRT